MQPLTDEECLRGAECLRQAGGNQTKAAELFGGKRSTFQNVIYRAAERGLLGYQPILPGYVAKVISTQTGPDGEIQRTWVKQGKAPGGPFSLPDNHAIKGVSALLDSDGNVVQQWVKTRADQPDIERVIERLKETFADLPPAAPVPPPDYADPDLLTVYPIADAHIGMRAWAKDTGESYDTDIAVARLRTWIAQLVASSPSSKEAVILDVGDMTHMDDGTNQTPASKHVLDVDGRFFRTLDLTIAALVDTIDLALTKHDRVIVVIIPGNHNPHSYLVIMFALAERYRDNPRVEVRKDPREFWAHRFGDCLLAAHHGDKAKPERLVMFLADEYAADWGATKHRFLWTGHLHHHRSADIGGVKWEQLRAVTARDAYAYTHAYAARSQLQAITLHRTAGEVQRQSVSPYSTGQ